MFYEAQVILQGHRKQIVPREYFKGGMCAEDH